MALNLSGLRPYLRDEEAQKQKHSGLDEMIDGIFREDRPALPVRNVQDKISRDSVAAVANAQSAVNNANRYFRPSSDTVSSPFSWPGTLQIPAIPHKGGEGFSPEPRQPVTVPAPESVKELEEKLRLLDENNKDFFDEWARNYEEYGKAYEIYNFEKINEKLRYIRENKDKRQNLLDQRKKLEEKIRTHPETLEFKKGISHGVRELYDKINREKDEEPGGEERSFMDKAGDRLDVLATRKLLRDSQVMIEAAEEEKDGTFIGGAGRGMRDKVLDVETWTMGIATALKNTSFMSAVDKYEKGEKLTSGEEDLLTAAALYAATLDYYGADLGNGYRTGQVVGDGLATAVETVVTPGLGVGKGVTKSLARYGTRKLGSYAMNETLRKILTRRIPRLTGDVAEATARTAVYEVPKVAANTLERRTGGTKYATDGDSVKFAGTEDGDTWLRSLSEALGAAGIRNFAPMTKEYFPEAGKYIAGSGFLKNPKTRWLKELMDKGSASQWGKAIRKVEKDFGPGKEFGARFVEDAMNSLLIGDVKAEDIFSLSHQIDNFIAGSLAEGFKEGIEYSGRAVRRAGSREKLSRISSEVRKLMGDEWDSVRDHIDKADVGQATAFIKEMAQRPDITPEAKKRMLDYFREKMHYISREKAWSKREEEGDISVSDDSRTEDGPASLPGSSPDGQSGKMPAEHVPDGNSGHIPGKLPDSGDGRQSGESAASPDKSPGFRLPDKTDAKGNPFIASAAGSADFARLSPAQAQALGTQTAAPVRLSSGDRTYGESCIDRRRGMLKKKGYASAREFVTDVMDNFDEIRREKIRIGEDGKERDCFLFIRKGEKNAVLKVVLSPDGTYYDIRSGGIFENSYIQKRQLLWEAGSGQAGPHPPAASGHAPAASGRTRSGKRRKKK